MTTKTSALASTRSPTPLSPWALCVAPMMDWTDRNCRFFHRMLAPHARLYTEMVVAQAIRFGDRQRLLAFNSAEHPVALQLGGSDPDLLAEAATIGAEFGYDEINLNCGCPSDRVQAGRFGACLMLEPHLVAECLGRMRDVVGAKIPVTVKCRLGVDEHDSFEHFLHFVDVLAAAGTRVFIVHARKAWLRGLSPRENREVPPLWYDRVHQLKQLRPDLTIVLNGGLQTAAAALRELAPQDEGGPRLALDGVMLGRTAYHHSMVLTELEEKLFGTAPIKRSTIAARLQNYFEAENARCNLQPRQLGRHILGLLHTEPGTRAWRQALSDGAEPLKAWTRAKAQGARD